MQYKRTDSSLAQQFLIAALPFSVVYVLNFILVPVIDHYVAGGGLFAMVPVAIFSLILVLVVGMCIATLQISLVKQIKILIYSIFLLYTTLLLPYVHTGDEFVSYSVMTLSGGFVVVKLMSWIWNTYVKNRLQQKNKKRVEYKDVEAEVKPPVKRDRWISLIALSVSALVMCHFSLSLRWCLVARLERHTQLQAT